ncbi:transposase [Enterococcus faecalis]|uniref:Transposase n=1 Tax=Enterococcus faecalis TaxID=1351 RepID=A0A974NZ62_ENTFL|nr:transposase [Enterococcus faecalis]
MNHYYKHLKKRTYPRKMRTVLQTLEKYINPIQNAFKYTLSNGPIEGVNNKSEKILNAPVTATEIFLSSKKSGLDQFLR